MMEDGRRSVELYGAPVEGEGEGGQLVIQNDGLEDPGAEDPGAEDPGVVNGGKLAEFEDSQLIDPPKHRPILVALIILACCIMFLVSLAKNDWHFASFTSNPMLGPPPSVLVDLGAKLSSKIVAGEWWRLIAPMFLHAGLLHLGINMFMLWRLGASLEESYGFIRLGTIYFLSGLFGILMSAIFLPKIPGVGASGAIFGLVGALFGDYFHNHQYIQDGKWYVGSLIASSITGLVIGLLPLLDNFGHIGGWYCGVISGTVFLTGAGDGDKGFQSGKIKLKSVVVLLALAMLIGSFIVAFAVLYSSINGNDWCSGCKNLSCLRGVPWWDCEKQYCQEITRVYSNGTTVTTCEPY